MPELIVSGVHLDSFLSLPQGTVINAVPESEREWFCYWRAAHVGKLALNILRGKMVVNAGETDDLIFFSDRYEDGPRIAENITRRGFQTQWKEQDAQQFTELTGVAPPEHSTAIVYAARYVGGWPTSKWDPGWGCSTEGRVGFHEIDRYSLQALEDLFQVDLLGQPEIGGDHAPAPDRGPIVPPSVSRLEHVDTWHMPGRASGRYF